MFIIVGWVTLLVCIMSQTVSNGKQNVCTNASMAVIAKLLLFI